MSGGYGTLPEGFEPTAYWVIRGESGAVLVTGPGQCLDCDCEIVSGPYKTGRKALLAAIKAVEAERVPVIEWPQSSSPSEDRMGEELELRFGSWD